MLGEASKSAKKKKGKDTPNNWLLHVRLGGGVGRGLRDEHPQNGIGPMNGLGEIVS